MPYDWRRHMEFSLEGMRAGSRAQGA
jgi:hypothetical protein